MRVVREQTRSHPIQRDIHKSDEYDAEVPGLRNFGTETAYNIEFEDARIVMPVLRGRPWYPWRCYSGGEKRTYAISDAIA